MDELINKTELMNDLKKDMAESDNWLIVAMYMAFIVRLTSYPGVDAVKVIPCKDCKWWDDKYEAERCTHDFGCRWAKPNNFCGYAERRTE